MLKKITIAGVIGVIILVSVAALLSDSGSDSEEKEVDLVVIEPDVIMPTKVSRPGCEIDDVCYIPSQFTVQKGDSVTWVNEDSAFHSVTSGFYDAPTELFDSGYLDPFQSFSYTFDDTGIYDYYCTLHPWMEGKITVE